jgi:hypothetical protein
MNRLNFFSSLIYVLGPHSWTGARNTILTVEDRIEAPLQTREPALKKKSSGLQNLNLTKTLFGLFAFLLLAYLLNTLFKDF